jgi:integrase
MAEIRHLSSCDRGTRYVIQARLLTLNPSFGRTWDGHEMPRITDKLIRDMPNPKEGQKIERDTTVVGFGVRKTASGHTAFVFNYTLRGRDRRMTIGQYPAWSVAAARQAAAKLRLRVDAGDDPLEEQQVARAEYTLAQLWDRYDKLVVPRKAESTQKDERSLWKRLILPKLGRRRLSHIRPSDVDAFHLAVSATTPVQANRCIASIRHAFNMAIRWELASFNPVTGIKKNSEPPRQRYLDDLERARFVAALDERQDTPSVLALHFLLLTGARRGEVLKARWEQIDFVQEAWIKPSAHTKQRRLHRVPLSKSAMNILGRARRLSNGDYIFPGRSGEALTEIKKTFSAVCREAGIEGLRIHDLRHSYASALVSRGTSLPIIGGLLGHTQVSTTARYSHLADDAMRQATNLLNTVSVGDPET